jgi:hypothetical protein
VLFFLDIIYSLSLLESNELDEEYESLKELQIKFVYFGCIIQALLESRQQYGAVRKSIPWSLSTLSQFIDVLKNADLEDKNISIRFVKVNYFLIRYITYKS